MGSRAGKVAIVLRLVSVLALLLAAIWYGMTKDINALASLLFAVVAFLKSEVDFYRMSGVPHAHDEVLFEQFVLTLPVDTISFLSENDFSAYFPLEKIVPLHNFEKVWADVGHEFVDKDLETQKRRLWESISDFLDITGQYLFPANDETLAGRNLVSIPKEWRYERPEEFRRVYKTIHQRADAVVKEYNEFVRLARRKLKQ